MKKKLPVAVWKEIQPLLDENRKLFNVVISEKRALYLKDCDKDSDFYFSCDNPDSSGKYVVQYKPINEFNTNITTIGNVGVSDLKNYLEAWIKVLRDYEETPSFYDKKPDLIIKQYTQEFYEEIILDEPNSDSAPFEFRRQILLQEYLIKIKGLLEDYKANPLEKQIEVIEEIQEECAALEETITTLPKNEVLKRISAIWAKGRKYSLDLAKKMLEEFAKECAKTVAKAALEKPEGIFEFVRGLIE